MSRRTRSDEQRRAPKLRRETLRVLDARQLGGIAGGDADHGAAGRDPVYKGRHVAAREGSRYCSP